MSEEPETNETAERDAQEPLVDPIHEVQTALGLVDPNALLVGFVAVAEWVEPDGSSSMSVVHTRMTPWHAHGLLHYAGEHLEASSFAPQYVAFEDDEDDDDEL